jgi:hypothetical protein
MKCPTCSTPVADESAPSCPSCGSSLAESDEHFAPTRILEESDETFAPTRRLAGPPPPSRTPPRPSGGSASRSRPRTSSSIHDSTIDNARFVAGTMLDERYRIVGLLGRGGMGEVYRADDLKLEQPVALKFLPESLSLDGAALARFHREVRVARQISHRNVCRIYDIGETEGLHYISMEFIRGEELASVVKRFGRLPADKATEIARQICAGLAAAHDAGVLHRDLKPANVMIDERGDARIMDFGLAGLAEEFEGGAAVEGTPEYMSPEQFTGGELTARSDVYSLGLVLYELFTGRKAFTANTLPELIRLRKTEPMPESPSMFARDLDPVIERVIERCLSADPKDRPSSALQVAAALPGGDPLAAALAAGETPSPEMVAASATEGALKPALAASLLAFALAALAAGLYLSAPSMLHRRVPLEKSAQGLRERAAEVTRRLGYTEASDVESGFTVDGEYLSHIKESDPSPARWDRLAAGQPAAMYFWYRQSPRYLLPYNGKAVTPSDPPRTISGMAGVALDTRGRLVTFYAVPPHLNDQQPPTQPGHDWSPLFAEAGLDISKFRPVEPSWLPGHPYDALAAWEGAYPDRPDATMQVQAAAFRGRPVYFHIVDPWNRPTRQVATPVNARANIVQAVLILFLLVILLGASMLARRNLRLGRGDRRGAFRLALIVFAVYMIIWLLSAHHVPELGEFNLFMENLAWSLMFAAMMWVVYVALEPFVRRRWPRRIVSWSRLLTGDFRDPMVGRDILIGAVAGFGLVAVGYLGEHLAHWMGMPPATPGIHGLALQALIGTKQVINSFGAQIINAYLVPAGILLLLLLFSFVLRREWLAVGLLVVITTLIGGLQGENPAIDWPMSVLSAAVTFFLLLRFGLLAIVAMQFFIFTFLFYPVTTDFSAWYAGSTVFALAVAVALTAYAFYISLGGQKLFKGDFIGD